jgi:intein/homing endonuclease
MVSRTKNNKSLVARWEKLASELPVGEIVVYQIEYRNRGKDIIMTARISATFDFFSILELEDASAYEVHVGTACKFHVPVLLVCINWN